MTLYTIVQTSNSEQVNVLIQLSNTTSDLRLRVKCIGTLECLAQDTNAIANNQVRLHLLPANLLLTLKLFFIYNK